ncbi:DEAD/DEAH box helicase family protein [Dethiothermospora halolimnae]|uniref:DEAD/DEAH box helicase family protein n=1 Tax=Dethiothermospora halolimnae TaxID=3114390 RepID=UPI003CCC44A8
MEGTKDKLYRNTNCITGINDHLYSYIKAAIEKAISVDIIVAFLMESGVRLLEEDLKKISKRNIPIRILTGNYLNITEPSALYLIRSILGDKGDVRFYADKSRSFHPKAYMFNYKDGGEIFIGSSNISKSAMTKGVEWNYRINKKENIKDFMTYKEIFQELFYNNSIVINDDELRRYSINWKKPKLSNGREMNLDIKEDKTAKVTELYKPRGAQIEALYELENARESGIDKGLVVAATGVGKTYLAAFDSKDYNKILFVAHREEILKQAEETFNTIRPDSKTGFFMGDNKNVYSDIIFASAQTLGKESYLNNKYFKPDHFDYIIIDEFHHAVAKSYRNIIEYFNPKFMLGLTATPDRLDNKDIYELCDYNVIYEATLNVAINKGWLVPFRYYGVYDDSVDYKGIDLVDGKYNKKQLEEALSINKRANLILKNYLKFSSNRALGFCTSREHAEFMAKYFNENNVRACSVYSGEQGTYSLERNKALEKLKNKEINIIFSVDMFNEGLDIKSLDMVLFLRPTESPTIFLQQLGRGLRKDTNKKYLNVLDFIGNYKKAHLIPFLLKGTSQHIKGSEGKNIIPREEDLPEECRIDFDFRLIDIFKKISEESKRFRDKIIEEYYRIKNEIDKRPSRVDMLTYMDNDIYNAMKKKSKNNIFKNYIGFLNKNKELLEEEKNLLNTVAIDFINMIENTSMSKTYKMPVLLAFYNNGKIKMKIDDNDIYKSFKEFYSKGSNGIDMLRDKSTKNYKSWDKKQYVNLAKRNPIKYLKKTHSNFFYEEEGLFCLDNKLNEYINNKVFIEQFKDAINFRTKQFYKNRLNKYFSKYK